MQFRNLSAFARWFLSQPLGALRIPDLPIAHLKLGADDARDGSEVTGIVLYRQAPYQVELFCMHPSAAETKVPVHRHPNVDSFEFFLNGGVNFILNEHRFRVPPPPDVVDGVDPWRGALLSVRARDWHGAAVESLGGSFFSIQRWRDGVEPTSVTHDWIGPAHVSHSDVAA